MGKGSNTSSSNSTSRADPQAEAAYRDLITRAQGVAGTPYQAYTGQLSAPTNAQQNLGVASINDASGWATPYLQNANSMVQQYSGPIDASTIQQYQNPYTQQVIDATTAEMRNQFGQQQAGLTSNAISQGALGGNGVGVARGVLAGQQGRTMASTVANLWDNSYKQAMDAAQKQQAVGLQGANAIANYGLQGQNAGLQAGMAQFGTGQTMQTAEQAALDRLYGQYQQQQAYPYQQAQWLAGMTTGLGSNLGGTSSGTTTGPQPNSTGQWLGAGLSLASMFLSDERAKEDIEHIGHTKDGQKIYRYRYKDDPSGRVHMGLIAQEVEERHPEAVQPGLGGLRMVDMESATDEAAHRASGGGVGAQPWSGGLGWIPQMQIHAGQGAPRASAPSLGKDGGSGFDPEKAAKSIGQIGKGLGGIDWGMFTQPNMEAINNSMDILGTNSGGSFYGPGFADGGAVMSDMDPPGLAGGQQFAQASPWQMRPNGNGTVSVINIRTGQVIYTGSPSGAANAQASAPRPRADGGAVMDWDQPVEMFNEGGLGFNPIDAGASDVSGGGYNAIDAEAGRFPMAPMADEERARGHDMLRRGLGTRSPDMIPDGEPPPAIPEDTSAMPVFGPDGKMMGNLTSGQGQAPHSSPVVAGEDEVPEMATPTQGAVPGLGSPAVRSFAATGPGSYEAMPDAVTPPRERERGFGLGLLSPNAQTGMLAAGLGMLASRSPFLGNVVGEGGLAGLGTYSRAEERDRQIAAEAEKLSREAKEKQQKFGLEERRLSESERHNRASERISSTREKGDRLPPGLRIGADGKAEVIPGVEEGLGKISAARRPPQGELIADEDAAFLADRVAAGDTKALVGLGRGAQGAQNLIKVNRMLREKAERGEPVSAAAREILQNAAQQQGLIAAERTQANIMAKLSIYGRTAFNATDIALDLSKKVPRTNFQPVNKILNAARTKTGDPNIVALGQALMTLTNEYARAIGGGHGTVHDKEAAEKRLSEAQSHEQLEAVIKTMRLEILAEERAMPQARQHIRDIYNPKPGGGVHSIAGEHGQPNPQGPVSGASGIPAPAAREKGRVYPTPKGDLRWNGSGWERP